MKTLQMLRILGGTQCACGKKKGEKMSHCRKCYYQLNPEERKALYNRVGEGYEEAYLHSLEVLGIDPATVEAGKEEVGDE